MSDEQHRAEHCDGCRFWDRIPAGELQGGEAGRVSGNDSAMTDLGRCRRRPPALSDEQTRRTLALPQFAGRGIGLAPASVRWLASLFPVTHEGEWCGEWAPVQPAGPAPGG
jgi:hypothetical protein